MNEFSPIKDTLCFGDPDGPGKSPEFGECYHAAAFLAASSAHRIKIVSRWNDDYLRLTKDFLNEVSPGSTEIVSKKPKGADDMGKSANYFSANTGGLPQKIEEKLKQLLEDKDRIAQVAKHLKPFESNLSSCLLWVRHGKYRPERNLTGLAFQQLKSILMEAGVRPIIIGSKPPYEVSDEPNLIEFYLEEDIYKNDPLMQLVLLNQLCEKASVKFAIGMKSGAMDGLAFARRLPTHYITNLSTNGRMDKVESAFPAFKKLLVAYDRKFMAFSPQEMERVFADISYTLLSDR